MTDRTEIISVRAPYRKLAGVPMLPIVVTALAAPFLLFPTPAALLGFVLVLLVRLWSAQRTPPMREWGVLDLPVWGLLLLSTLNAVTTPDLPQSLGKLAGMALGGLIYFTVLEWKDRRSVSIPMAIAGATGGALAIIALLGTHWLDKFELIARVSGWLPLRLRGMPGAEDGFHPNAVAGILVIFVPLQLTLAIQSWRVAAQRSHWRCQLAVVVSSCVALVSLLVLLLSQSRGAWCGLSVAVMAWQYRGNSSWQQHARYGVAGTVALVAFVLAVLVLKVHWIIPAQAFGAALASSIDSRIELWGIAWQAIGLAPITGFGFNGFREVLLWLTPTFRQSALDNIPHAHNHLLQAALDLGVPGLATYIWLWAALAREVSRLARQTVRKSAANQLDALAAGWLAHWIFSLFDVIPLGSKVGALFWLALGVTSLSVRELSKPVSRHRASWP